MLRTQSKLLGFLLFVTRHLPGAVYLESLGEEWNPNESADHETTIHVHAIVYRLNS